MEQLGRNVPKAHELNDPKRALSRARDSAGLYANHEGHEGHARLQPKREPESEQRTGDLPRTATGEPPAAGRAARHEDGAARRKAKHVAADNAPRSAIRARRRPAQQCIELSTVQTKRNARRAA